MAFSRITALLDDSIPSLSSFSDDESEEIVAPKNTTNQRALASPLNVWEASNLLFTFCKLVFAMMVMDNALGGKKKEKRSKPSVY